MKNKYFYPIYKLKIKSWIKYWLIKQTEFKGVLSDILEGISFYLTDCLNMKFKMFKIYGRTTQESTTGKNLAQVSEIELSGTVNRILCDFGEGRTFEKISFTIIADKATYNNQTSAIFKYINQENTENYISPNTMGITSGSISGTITYTLRNATIKTITLLNWAVIKGTIKIQIEDGDYTSYEPYTGGEPAPNPKYPFPIKNTGDNGSVNEKVSNSDGTQEQNISFPLAEGQKLMEGDYLADDGVHHKMKEIDLSTLTWLQYVTNRYQSDDLNNIIKKPASSAIKAFALATKYNIVPYSNSFVNGNMGVSYNGRISVYDNTGTPSGIFQYELEEEVIDPYTEEQQTAWEQIKKARTYKNITHISSEDETPAELKIQYWKEG